MTRAKYSGVCCVGAALMAAWRACVRRLGPPARNTGPTPGDAVLSGKEKRGTLDAFCGCAENAIDVPGPIEKYNQSGALQQYS